MRSVRKLLLAATIVAAAQVVPAPAAASATPAPGDRLGIQLLDAPVSGNNDPRAHIYIVDRLKTGTTITRHVKITNSSGDRTAVSVYAAAATISGGQFRFGTDKARNELTAWTTVTPAALSIAPGAAAQATIRITVPTHTTSGERYAVIWAQLSSPRVTGRVQQINRVGIRVYLDIAGNQKASDFSVNGITASRDKNGSPRITAQVHNTGGRAVDIAGTAALSDGPGGLRTDPTPTNATVTIGPGDTQRVSASFDKRLSAGPWLVTVKLASGTLHRSATATVRFPVSAGAGIVVPSAHAKHGVAWWLWAGGALGLLLAFLAAVWVRRRRSPAPPR
ncbi:MAG: peptidase [Pseudonocardiales bacterium]|nr:MAG: peptidase [Pseudonocardiales bacterium]